MTDRVQALTVVLDRDFRDDDVQSLIDAILHLKGVAEVTTQVVTAEDHFARLRVRSELRERILKAVIDTFEQEPK